MIDSIHLLWKSNGGQNYLQMQRIVASYEEKQREILQENRDLRAALESLQAEHRGIANQQARTLHIVNPSLLSPLVEPER